MQKTRDGREVQAIYDGNVFIVFVQERPGSTWNKRVWSFAPGAGQEYVEAVERAVAANDGVPPLVPDPYLVGFKTIDITFTGA